MSDRSLRILMLASQYPPTVGGGGAHAYYLSRELTFDGRSEAAAEVLVLTAYGRRESAEYNIPGHPALRIHPMDFGIEGKVPYERAVEGAIHAHRNFKPDIVHGQHLQGAYIGLHVRAATGTPLVVTLHKTPLEVRDKELATRYPTYAFMKMLGATGLVDMFVAGSQVFLEDLEDLGVPREKCRLIMHGIPRAAYESSAYVPDVQKRLRELLAVESGQLVVLCPCRLDPRRKEIHTLFKAVAKLAAAVRDKEFVIVVTGVPTTAEEVSYRTDLEELAKKLNLSNSVRFLKEPISFADMPALNAISATTVLPSRIEGLGLALIEAMAVRVPVVGSNVRGINEVIEKPEEHGMRYCAGDDEDLASCLIRLFTDGDVRDRLRGGGHRQFRARFTAERMANEHAQLYRTLLT